jgi:2-(1,2-epoxy-1,2-dihydrophenyl)acetyl-CoA isomerase
MADSVLCDLDGAVATITLNRPSAKNALTAEMKAGLLAALRECSSDTAVRAVILTGAGQSFCAGQDLREYAELLESGAPPMETVRAHYNPTVTTIATMPKPVIAAISGVAAGAGAALAFACDFRVAARDATLMMAFAKVALGADSGASWTLQRLTGTARAAELLMLAEPVTADRALSIGLLNSIVDVQDLPAAAAELATRLAAGPTAAFAAIKEGLAFAATHDLAESLEKEAQLQDALAQTDDHTAATLAFVRKQPAPSYQGR